MATKDSTSSPPDDGVAKTRGRQKILALVVLLLASAGGAYWFLLRPAPEPAEPEPGEVLALEAIQVNLKAGHYLQR